MQGHTSPYKAIKGHNWPDMARQGHIRLNMAKKDHVPIKTFFLTIGYVYLDLLIYSASYFDVSGQKWHKSLHFLAPYVVKDLPHAHLSDPYHVERVVH